MRKHYTQRVISVSTSLGEKYHDIITTDERAFTRVRKIKLSDLFIQMLLNKGRSQKNELCNFYSEVNKDMDVSATAFFNARMKFNSEALLTIMQDVTREEYEDSAHLSKYNGYHIFAIDGSEFSLPATDETRLKYGTSKNHKGDNKNTVLSSVSTIYDCNNELFLDIKIKPYRSSELLSAIEHVSFLKSFLPSNEKNLILLDRNYSGIRLIDYMIEKNQRFLVRLSSNRFKKETRLLTDETPDKWINVTYTGTRANNYKKDPAFYDKITNTTYTLRFIKVKHTDNDEEEQIDYYLTNLPEEDFSADSIYDLYHMRWKIETGYRSLKSQMNVEDFSGVRDNLIRQDIYASAFVYNNISMTIAEMQIENNSNQSSKYKHPRKVNRNFALGILKKDLLIMFTLHKNKEAVEMAQNRYESNIIKYSCPIREGRSRPRKTIGSSKQKVTYKKSY